MFAVFVLMMDTLLKLFLICPSSPLPPLQSSLAQLGIPLTDVIKILVSILLVGNILFYEAKNQELSVQGVEGQCRGQRSMQGVKGHHPPPPPDLRAVADLLGVEPQLLQRGLTLRTYHSQDHGETVHSPCSAAAVGHMTIT